MFSWSQHPLFSKRFLVAIINGPIFRSEEARCAISVLLRVSQGKYKYWAVICHWLDASMANHIGLITYSQTSLIRLSLFLKVFILDSKVSGLSNQPFMTGNYHVHVDTLTLYFILLKGQPCRIYCNSI